MATVGISIGLSFSVSLVMGPLLVLPGGCPGFSIPRRYWRFWRWWWLPRLCPHRTSTRSVPTPIGPEMVSRVLADGRLLRLDFGIFILHFVLTALFLVSPTMLQDQLGLKPVPTGGSISAL